MSSPVPHTHVRRISTLERRTAVLAKNLDRARGEKADLQHEVAALRGKVNAYERAQLEAWERDLTTLLSDVRTLLNANVKREKRA